MSKYRLWIEELHRMVYEVEAPDADLAARAAVLNGKETLKGCKVLSQTGIVEATVKRTESIDQEAKTVEAVKNYNPLDKSHVSN